MAELSIESRMVSSFSRASGDELSASNAQQPDKKVMEAVTQVKQNADSTDSKESSKSVADTVAQMNESSTIRNTSLQFVFDEKGEPPVVKVIDKDNGETIRQIPSELVVKLSKAIEEMADNSDSRMGFLFDNEI